MDAEWASYAPDTRPIATAFVAGINAYIALVHDRPPVEFTLLGYAPEPWTPQVPLQRMAALAMTGNAEFEVLRAQLVNAIGVERTGALWPTIPHRDLDPAPGLSFSGISTLSLGAYADAVGPVSIPRVVGSNNWVVSGALTTTGKPLLANDPHRYLDTPSLRYLTHLVAPGWNVIGAGEPALAVRSPGHGVHPYPVTASRCTGRECARDECVRIVTEEFNGTACRASPGSLDPKCATGVRNQVVDTIAVKGEPPRIVTLEFTEHGPLVDEDATHDADGHSRGFALRFVGSEPGTAGYLAQISVDRATDWKSFLDAAARWKLPTENLVYADVDGNIGWIAAGLMPKRHWSGLLPVPGTGGYEWTGYRSVDELPRAFNPESGFIVTANHDIRPPGYTVPLNFEFATPFRARRIADVLSDPASGRFSVADFQRLQHDEYSSTARTLVPQLLAAARRAVRDSRWEYSQLRGWTYVMRADGTAPLLFELWKAALSADALRRLARSPDAVSLLPGESWLDYWPSPDGGLAGLSPATRDTLMLAAMDSAMARARARLGMDSTTWRWGTLHTAVFAHHVAGAFDLPPVPRGGNANTVNATAGSDYHQQYGASFREILDFADWDRSTATSVPGQSGQPESEFHADLLPLWARGAYFPLVYSRSAIERETKHLLWLRPHH